MESQITEQDFMDVNLILFAESLQKHGFNCSDDNEWHRMRQLILSKLRAVDHPEQSDLSYMMCVTNNHKQCREEGALVSMVQRKCHLFSHMEFLQGNRSRDYKHYVITSAPGAGIKWMRLLMEELTGIFTGSSYCDKLQLFSGFFGESVTSKRVLAVSTYEAKYSMSEYDSVVYIIRNPYHTIVSQLSKKRGAGADRGLITAVDDEDLEKGLQEWTASIESWLVGADKPIHVVSYDQLLATTEAELLRLIEFLDYPISAATLNCVVQSYSNLFRYDRFGSRNPYTEAQMSKIQEAIMKYKEVWHGHKVSFHWTWET